MKVIYMHFKLFLCALTFAIVLGVITVTPCTSGQKCSMLGRAYGFDKERLSELTDKAGNLISKCCCKKHR